MKDETVFRKKVLKFFNSLDNSAAFPIQQVALIGDADYIACMQGMFVWCEIKTNKGTASAMQEYKASCVTKAGGIALIIRPKNWVLVKSFLTLLNGGIYDKNVLRTIKQHELSKSDVEAHEYANEEPQGVQNQTHWQGNARRKP